MKKKRLKDNEGDLAKLVVGNEVDIAKNPTSTEKVPLGCSIGRKSRPQHKEKDKDREGRHGSYKPHLVPITLNCLQKASLNPTTDKDGFTLLTNKKKAGKGKKPSRIFVPISKPSFQVLSIEETGIQDERDQKTVKESTSATSHANGSKGLIHC